MPARMLLCRHTSGCILAFLTLILPPAARADDDDAFETAIRPVLAGTCFPCHGGKTTSAGLRVDSREALLKGGDRGPAIVPGKPEDSPIVLALRHAEPDLAMPPGKDLGKPVADAFADWVRNGAPWAKGPVRGFDARPHWAFQPIKPPGIPDGTAPNPVDRFLDKSRKARGIAAVPPADRRTLIRRLTFDLIGLPPTPGEVDTFLADDDPKAYEHLVDRLLDRPQYGERWGRHWLDVARYADTAGDNADYPVPEARLYRDYVIDAFNADIPFDRFVREQLAGDILAKKADAAGKIDAREYARLIAATGFVALARRYATGPEELWHLTLEDAVDTTGRALLGLTMRCARCHDHKYDPITQTDYYALYGVFASTQFPYAGSEEFVSKQLDRTHFVPLVPDRIAAPLMEQYRKTRDKNLAELAEAEAEGKAAVAKAEAKTPEGKAELEKAKKAQAARLAPIRDRAKRWNKAGGPPDLPLAFAVVDKPRPVDVAIHQKGDPGQPGPVVRRGVIKAFAGARPPAMPAESSGRLELASWIASPDNPLTARVFANRVWKHHFGKGLVATPSNFGTRAEAPTHPELLDFLASEFIKNGWSVKALHRLIVTSDAYRLGSNPAAPGSTGDPSTIDPANTLYWKFDRHRLDAESLRDAWLSASGNLDPRRPGPHPFPAIHDFTYTQHNAFKAVYPSNHRSVYLMTQRLQRHPYLSLFDGPDPNTSTESRTSATIPLQTLYLQNNPYLAEQSRAFAKRLTAAALSPTDRLTLALNLAWNRPPTPDELARFTAYLTAYRQQLAHPDAELESWTSLCRVILTANEFLYIE